MKLNPSKLHLIAFGLTMAFYIGFPFYMIGSYEQVLASGEVYRFRPEPVDPFHPFKGRYISLRFAERSLPLRPADSLLYRGDPIYLSLGVDESGYAHAEDYHLSPPEGKPYFKAEISWVNSDKLNINYPFDEYYLNEKLAPEAEEVYREMSGAEADSSVYLDVRVKNGLAIIEQLYIQGIPIESYLKQQAQSLSR